MNSKPGAGGGNKTPQGKTGAAPAPELTLADLQEQVRVRFEKLNVLRARGENPYKNGYSPAALAAELHRAYDEKTKEELEPMAVRTSIAGRIIAIRDFGKAGFLQIRDRSGVVQFYVSKDKLGDAGHARYKELDVGDIVFGEGALFKTKTGELAVWVETLDLLTKSLRPLPEKFHGLSDVETKYRQRYIDLITSEQTRETFRKRSQIVAEVRNFFLERDFMEVETPMMHPIVGGGGSAPVRHASQYLGRGPLFADRS